MPAALIVALIIALSAIICVLIVVAGVRYAAHRHAHRPVQLPHDGHTAERARRLEEESRRYRNILSQALLAEDYERKGRRE